MPGNVLTATDANGNVTDYKGLNGTAGYDADRRLPSVIDAAGNQTLYPYDPNGHQAQILGRYTLRVQTEEYDQSLPVSVTCVTLVNRSLSDDQK